MGCLGRDDGRVASGIVHMVRNRLQWKRAPRDEAPHNTLYNRFIRWSRLTVFDRIFARLAGERPRRERIMIDSAHRNADRTAASLLKTPAFGRPGGTGAGLNSQLHTVCDENRRPIIMQLSAGPMSDHEGARRVLDALPPTGRNKTIDHEPTAGSIFHADPLTRGQSSMPEHTFGDPFCVKRRSPKGE